uniref:Uncharacterized protein n=1 Tax=Ditylenchus dipsaci TaxID=166011 RepID=A0A915DUQ5_9BILA
MQCTYLCSAAADRADMDFLDQSQLLTGQLSVQISYQGICPTILGFQKIDCCDIVALRKCQSFNYCEGPSLSKLLR